MSNTYFQFKQFTIHQDKSAMKVTTDGCLFGAWVVDKMTNEAFKNNNCLDIGTGTGLLALMLAQKNPNLSLSAFEIDIDSFEQASKNIADSPWSPGIKIVHGDIKKFQSPEKFDLIISNPPFYKNELKGDNTKKNIAHHDEGLLLPELLTFIKNNLSPEGTFYLLLPFKRKEEIKNLLLEHEFDIVQMTFVRQTLNHNFFRIMLSGKLKENKIPETVIDEIAIKDEKDNYTDAFIALLQDYYLHL